MLTYPEFGCLDFNFLIGIDLLGKMEAKVAKVLDSNSQSVMLGLKRKRASRYAAYFAEASRITSPEWPTVRFSTYKPRKQRKTVSVIILILFYN